jgi:hypothetical protein
MMPIIPADKTVNYFSTVKCKYRKTISGAFKINFYGTFC